MGFEIKTAYALDDYDFDFDAPTFDKDAAAALANSMQRQIEQDIMNSVMMSHEFLEVVPPTKKRFKTIG